MIGVRAFALGALLAAGPRPFDRTMEVLTRHYPGKRWLVTEYRPDEPSSPKAPPGGSWLPLNVEGVVSFVLAPGAAARGGSPAGAPRP